MTQNSETKYGVASGLIGFGITDTLRVRIIRYTDANGIIVVTADLLDAGTILCLDTKQVVLETPETDLVHKNGLVSFQGCA